MSFPFRIVLILLLAGSLSLPAAAGENPYAKIDSTDEAHALLTHVASELGRAGLSVRRPVSVDVVTGSALDALLPAGDPYRGGESVYEREGSAKDHDIYLLTGWDRDIASGLLAFAYTLAWARESAPTGQDPELTRAFAQWVAYRYLVRIGASTIAQHLERYIHSDARQDELLEQLFTWQDKVGPAAVVRLVATSTTLPSPGEVAPQGYQRSNEDVSAPPPGYRSTNEDPDRPAPGYGNSDEDSQAAPPGYRSSDEDSQARPPGYQDSDEDSQARPPGYQDSDEDSPARPPGY